MHEVPDSQLLQREATTHRQTSQTLLKLAETLYSAAKILESKADEIEQQSECAKSTEARSRRVRRIHSRDDLNEKAQKKRESLEQRSTVSAMRAVNTLKQEKIINTAVQSLVGPNLEELEDSSKDAKHSGGEVLSQLSPDNVPSFVCYLAAEMLTDPGLMVDCEKAESAESPATSGYCVWKGPLSDDKNTSPTRSALPEVEDQRPYMPEVGFLTNSNWAPINRRQHW